MYPIDKVVLAGSNTTFCCILGEGQSLQDILYMKSVMKEIRLSRRAYAVTQTLQPPSMVSGANIFCRVATDVANNGTMKPSVTGTVIFVGCKHILSLGGTEMNTFACRVFQRVKMDEFCLDNSLIVTSQ